MKLLSNHEAKEKAKAEAEYQRQLLILEDIKKKEQIRQSKINANEREHMLRMGEYTNDCQIRLRGKDCFTRLCVFIDTVGPNRRGLNDVEWSNLIRSWGLTEVMDMINKVGSPPLKAPIKKEISEIDLLED